MVWLFKKNTQQEAPSQKILSMMDELSEVKIQIKEIKNDITKLEIKILENQKNYQTKLLRLVEKESKEEKKEERKDIYNGVCLLTDGSI